MGMSKGTWIKNYLLLDDSDAIIMSFQTLGSFDLSPDDFSNGQLPNTLAPLEAFACKVYAPKLNIKSSKAEMGTVQI